MQKFYFNNIPAIVNIDDGEDEQTTINTIIDILEDAGYEFEEDEEEVEGLNKLEKAKEIIKNNYRNAECGIFHTRNTLGDPMETIYFDDELQIDICRHFEYFEVFGLEEEEFKELARYYYSLMEEEVEE